MTLVAGRSARGTLPPPSPHKLRPPCMGLLRLATYHFDRLQTLQCKYTPDCSSYLINL